MLYTSLILGSLLYLSKGQDCSYSLSDLYSDSDFENNAIDAYSKDGSEQYVIFDFNFDNTATKGAYFLPFTFTDSNGDSQCHSSAFSTSAWMDFECDTGYDDDTQTSDTVVTMTFYQGTNCIDGTAAFTYWWTEGYSAYYDPDTLIPVIGAICSSATACEALNYTRNEVTQGYGGRYDFSCEGEPEYVSATLCADSGCASTVCASVSAAIGSGCLATPNSTFANLLVSCNNKEAYLTTFVDLVQYGTAAAGGQLGVWNDYTVDRQCSNDGSAGYICNQFSIPKDTCTESFEALGFTIYGYMSECSDPFSNSATNTYSFTFALLFSIIFAVFKL